MPQFFVTFFLLFKDAERSKTNKAEKNIEKNNRLHTRIST